MDTEVHPLQQRRLSRTSVQIRARLPPLRRSSSCARMRRTRDSEVKLAVRRASKQCSRSDASREAGSTALGVVSLAEVGGWERAQASRRASGGSKICWALDSFYGDHSVELCRTAVAGSSCLVVACRANAANLVACAACQRSRPVALPFS